MRDDYPNDFGEYVLALSEDENADPVDLLSCLNELSEIGVMINENEISGKDVDAVFSNEGISKEVLLKIVDKFLIHVSEHLRK